MAEDMKCLPLPRIEIESILYDQGSHDYTVTLEWLNGEIIKRTMIPCPRP